MNGTSPALDREYHGDPVTLRTARRDVSEFLRHSAADNATIERASLIASELASNAIQAAPGRPYRLCVEIGDADIVTMKIHNQTEGGLPPARSEWRPTNELAVRGRGLSIVDSLADQVSVDTDGREVVVTAQFRLTRA